MKFTTLLASVSLVAALSSTSEAAITLNISANFNTGAFFTLSDGATRIPDGSLVRVGTFASAPSANASFAELELLFTEFATTTSGHTQAQGANKGMINRANIQDAAGGQPETFFQSKPVYIWVYNAPTAAAATHAGVFTTTAASPNGAWLFPDNVDAQPVSLTTAAITNAFGAAATAAKITTGTPNSYQLALIPEPSVAGFSVLTLAGLLVRRRRG